jgi:hypothetical protein
MRFLILVLFLLACGEKSTPEVSPPLADLLRNEINRMAPSLLWCDGQMTAPRNNNMDGRPNCDVGDGMAESGFLVMVGNFPNKQDILAAMGLSIAANGQPFRAPSYVGVDNRDEFSRDQLLGLAAGTISGLDQSFLRRTRDYIRSTGSLCPNPSDSRCKLTDSMDIIMKDALGENVSSLDRSIDVTTVNAEAETVPEGYQAGLVAKKVFFQYRLNRISGYSHAAMLLHKRFPQNLWFESVFLVTNGGKKSDYESVGQKLLQCMREWESPGLHWTWSQTSCKGKEAVGQELIALAYLLIPNI